MNKRANKLLALAAFSLLTSGVILPTNAAPSDKPKEASKPILPPQILEVAFIGAIAITGLSVLVGTGKSIKYNQSHSKSHETEPESDIIDSSIQEGNLDSIPNFLAEEDFDTVLAGDRLDVDQPVNGHSSNGGNGNGKSHLHGTNGHSQEIGANNDLEINELNNDSQIIANKENLSVKDLQVATNQQQLQELQKQLYRQKYQKYQQQVRQLPSFLESPTKEVDTWEIDVEVALMVLAQFPEDKKEVEQTLLQSDQVREWSLSLPEQEFQAKAAEYIEKTFSWAQELRKWREKRVSA